MPFNEIYHCMKRVFWHITFWIAYLFQDILLIYFLNTTRFELSKATEFVLAIENCLVPTFA